jgi:hypothetical protein
MRDRVHPNARKAATERCALCRGKLGLGTRFRNIWNGRWWVHIRFCSVRCEAIYEVRRNDAAKQRWHDSLARGNIRDLSSAVTSLRERILIIDDTPRSTAS